MERASIHKLMPLRYPPSSKSKRTRRGPVGKNVLTKRPKMRRSLIPNAVPMGRYAFPPRLENVMRYQATITLECDGSGNTYYQFRCNNLYDPDVAIGGQQPLYYDQLTPVYNHWTVTKSKMKVHVLNEPTVNAQSSPCFVTLFIDDDDTPPAAGGRNERGSAISYMIGRNDSDPGHTIYWNGQYAFGGNLIDNAELQGTAGAGPAETQVFNINITGAVGQATFKLYVDMEFTTVWSELKSIAGS